jgi:hypothetical protein
MIEQKTETPPTDTIPEVEVQSRIRQFSFVWVIPLVLRELFNRPF